MASKDELFGSYFQNTSRSQGSIISIGDAVINQTNDTNDEQENIKYQTAKGNLDFAGFVDSLKKFIDNTWEDGWGELSMDAPTSNDPTSVSLPMITCDIVSRVPSQRTKGIKARQTGVFPDPEDDNYSIIVSRKWFDVVAEFLVMDNTNREAMDLANRFELFIDTYTGFFKEQGVSELIFKDEVDARLSGKYTEGIPSRCLRYDMVLERVIVERVRTTKTIRANIQSLNKG